MVGTGIQHVVVLTTASQESSSCLPELDREALKVSFEKPKEEIKANGNGKPDADESKKEGEETPAPKGDAKKVSTVEKVLSQKEESKEISQRSSQKSRSSRKRSAADLKASQKALQPAPETVLEEADAE